MADLDIQGLIGVNWIWIAVALIVLAFFFWCFWSAWWWCW